MAAGILLASFFEKELYATMTGTLDWSSANPLMLLVVTATFLSQLAYPVWGIWLGRMLLRGAISLS